MKILRDHPGLVTKYTVYLVVFMATCFIQTSISSAQENKSCVPLLTERCETCHYLTRVCQKVDKERNKKSLFGSPKGTWKRIIKNMVKQGAQLNNEEENILIECLSKPTQEVLDECKLNK